MAARALSSGTISFGLVSIPVKLYSTVDSTKTIQFNFLAADGSRLKQQYISASTGKIVPNEERVRGYEFTKGQFVTFTDEEMKALDVEATNAIEISEFVPLDQVDRLLIEKVYYLGPDKGAARSYHLLKAAMLKTGRAAVAKYAARGKSHLVLLRPMGDGMVMEQLKHEDELRPFAEVPLDHVDVSDAELQLAIQIVDQITSDAFDPAQYKDEIRDRVLELIDRKVQGQEISLPPEAKPEAKIIDLMQALKASIATGKRTPAEATETAGKRTPAEATEAAGKRARGEKRPPRGVTTRQASAEKPTAKPKGTRSGKSSG